MSRLLTERERDAVVRGLRSLLGEDVEIGDLREFNPLLRSAIRKLEYQTARHGYWDALIREKRGMGDDNRGGTNDD